ncbi:MAG: 3-hydroxyacyl-CoA dehydrogenase family protein [Pseudomonadota bacterium]
MEMRNIHKIAVLGGGTMGPGIAQTFAQYNYDVKLWSRKEETIDRARRVIRTNLSTFAAHDLLRDEDIEPAMGRITFTTAIESAVEGADLIVETIIENHDEKKKLFHRLDKVCPEDAILTSNTSTLNIYEVVPEARLPSTVIAHWFAPPHILPLVEVVRGIETSDNTVNRVLDLLKKVGKIPVVMEKFIPGFAINRILRALGRETFFLLDNGYMTADQLDLAVKASIAPRMMFLGLVQRYDFTGLDLSAGNLQSKAFIDPPIDNEPKSLFELVAKGDMGVKTGKGFFDYTDKPLEETLKERDDYLIRVLKGTDFCLKSSIGKRKEEN